jgi:hypothetical protein
MNKKPIIKNKIIKMAYQIKNAKLYEYHPYPPTTESLHIRKLIEYAKITDFKQ